MLAPLRNPGAALGTGTFKNLLPDVAGVTVSGTVFHVTVPETAYRYPIVNCYYTDYKTYKCGIHGTSH